MNLSCINIDEKQVIISPSCFNNLLCAVWPRNPTQLKIDPCLWTTGPKKPCSDGGFRELAVCWCNLHCLPVTQAATETLADWVTEQGTACRQVRGHLRCSVLRFFPVLGKSGDFFFSSLIARWASFSPDLLSLVGLSGLDPCASSKQHSHPPCWIRVAGESLGKGWHV